MSEYPKATGQRGWWLTVDAAIREQVVTQHADYFTPEQLADLTEFGACFFEAEDGQCYYLQVGHWPLPWPQLSHDGRPCCMSTNLYYGNAMVAYKLLYQANVAGARAIAGRDGARLPV